LTIDVVIDAEIVSVLDRPAAEELDGDIRVLVRCTNDTLTMLHALVEKAKRGEIHRALGLPSWTAYLSEVFSGGGPLQVKGDARRELVSYLSGEGMSQRAIAEVVGVDQKTVSNDLRPREENSSPELGQTQPPKPTTGLDGKEYQPRPHKGRGNEKKQLKALEASTFSIRGVADALEAIFEGGFEKTCTPEIANQTAAAFRTEIARINKIIRLLDTHGK
jgi:transposase